MPCRWWIAGGYAIELAAGRRNRDHEDIDVPGGAEPGRRSLPRARLGWLSAALSRSYGEHPWLGRLA
jgi:hypothetical protein